MITKEILDDFMGNECVCRKSKGTRMSFCLECYHALPEHLQQALYRRFGSGYEEAYVEARAYIVDLAEEAERYNHGRSS